MAAKDLLIPKYYENKLDIISTEIAIKYVKDLFERRLAHHLNLMRISAPLYVRKSSGLNDDLNGIERPVDFDIKEIKDEDIEIVHSLAKWKRMALKRYNMNIGKGIYTDMNAIRRDEVLDNLHSTYVDQWDWEKIIDEKSRNVEFLKMTVRNIMKALKETEKELDIVFENLEPFIQEDVYFITSQELEDRYPDLTPKQREYEITKQYKTVFIMQIGDVLKSGQKHDGRAPDYDDWALNGDILLYYPILDCPIEISSMGIRVNKQSLQEQLKKAGCEERLQLPFHQMLMNDELPLTIGGGIGQSRICLILLNKAHIGEVQVSQWDDEMVKVCEEHHITLL
ncbi:MULTISPECIES: aspartate--ammonia ligase [Bacillota]|jgi:aspartate--ammonia ligase|uniref:Aspartate--ammonia ligase n=2 Tax=Amedibacillus TaxID=2749846 RepID=A0A7G9GL31_9FIRM|nr:MULTISPECIES: aspartate--ammonia ligase [Bacillota]QNM11513.1 aspartate--ammonia ligase [[Eubacterium] hominis]MCH4284471.1 aspartate--ammonia ligase [Amedibacillus hominis]RGB54642.1 aspartate--ammonia ligase [Absiella sp. AM22-9]RGB56276.1 aspartate--ammonia ligase [Absiella sp. AM10-20]RGB65774.1 aspartate--ammonia ligase [Absiella sp. AM09-45]